MRPIFRILTFTAVFFISTTAHAAVVVQSHWRMGEEAGDTDGRLDSVGGRTFSVSQGPAEFTSGVSPSSNGSTTAVNARNNGGRAGFYGPNFSSFMPADNWGIEIWVRSANTTQSINIAVQGSISNGHLKFGQLGTNWAASYHNVAWIGAGGGTGQPVSVETWTHLAVVRESGITSLYIDGVAQAGTTTSAPVWGTSFHVGVEPGGATGWNGDFDEVRAFTFAPGQFDPASDFLIIPEPATIGLLSIGFAGLLARRRKRR